MDPVTAFVNVATALLKFMTVVVEGQTPEQKKILWDLYIQDILWWRHFLKIDTLPK